MSTFLSVMAREVGPAATCFLIPNMSERGGTQGVVWQLVPRDGSALIVTLDGSRNVYGDSTTVGLIPLCGSPLFDHRIWRALRVVRQARSLARTADHEGMEAVVSFLARGNLVNILSKILFGSRHRCIIFERNFNSIQYRASVPGRLMLALMRSLYRRADLVLANARSLAIDLQETFGVHPDDIRVLYNPIDVRRTRRLSEQLDIAGGSRPDRPYFIFVGRFVPQKNLDLLLQAFSLVSMKTQCHLVLVGDGPLREQIEGSIRRYGLRGHVTLTGFLANPFPLLVDALALVLSSDFEGFPNVVVEAMALGCPVIATDSPGAVGELLEDGRGLIVPMRDPSGLADAMLSLIDDRELAASLTTRAASHLHKFDAERIRGQLGSLLCG